MAETIEEIIVKIETEGFAEAEKEMESLGDQTKETDKDTKQYGRTLKDVGGEVQIFGTSINSLKGGFTQAIATIRNSVKGLKAFKVALAGTGVGLLVIALGSMAVAISKSEAAMDKLTDAFDVVKTVIDVVIGAVAQLGQAFIKLINLDFEGAMEAASGAFANFGERIKENVELTLALNEANRELEVQLINNNIQIAKNNALIAENKRLADDTTLSIQARIAAAEQAQKLIIENGRLQREAAAEALRIATEAIDSENETNGVRERTREQLKELSELEIAFIQTKQQEEERLLEISNKVNVLRTEREKQFIAEKEKLFNADIQANQKAESKKNLDIGKAAQERGALAIKEADEKRKLYEQDAANFQASQDAQVAAITDAANKGATIASALGADQKAISISLATIEGALAVAKAIASAPFPLNLPAIGFAVAQGAAQIRAIASTPIPTAPTYGNGGLLRGPSHERGGIHINAEGGEAIINKRSTKMFKRELSMINQAGGGVPFMRLGGIVPNEGTSPDPFIDLAAVLRTNRAVLITEDLREAQTRVAVTEALTTF